MSGTAYRRNSNRHNLKVGKSTPYFDRSVLPLRSRYRAYSPSFRSRMAITRISSSTPDRNLLTFFSNFEMKKTDRKHSKRFWWNPRLFTVWPGMNKTNGLIKPGISQFPKKRSYSLTVFYFIRLESMNRVNGRNGLSILTVKHSASTTASLLTSVFTGKIALFLVLYRHSLWKIDQYTSKQCALTFSLSANSWPAVLRYIYLGSTSSTVQLNGLFRFSRTQLYRSRTSISSGLRRSHSRIQTETTFFWLRYIAPPRNFPSNVGWGLVFP